MVIDNLAKRLMKFADVTMVVPLTSSVVEDKDREYKVIRIKSMHVPFTEYKVGVPDLEKKKMEKMLLEEKFDIIHIHSPFTIGNLGVRIAKKCNIPVIATMHTRFDFEFRKYLKSKALVKLAIKKIVKVYNKCDLCIAINNAMIDVFRDFGYKGKTVTVYNGTDMTILDKPNEKMKIVNEKFGIAKNEIVFLFVGRIIEIKNIFFILEVMKKLKEKNLKFKMLYVGSGPDEKKLKEKIYDYNLADNVIMTGKITDRELLKAIYYRAKLFVFPSLFDASSLVQIEAACQKTPAIFIDGAVTADTVTNNVNGFTALNDVEMFTNRILDIINDDKLYESVRERCYKDLARSWDDIAKETYEVYTSIINLEMMK